MKELIQTIFSTSKERITNPIIGTFLISWTAFNWKPIIFLFMSDQKIEDKINYIDTNLTTNNNLLFYPLVAIVIYVLVIPYFNLLFEYLLEFSRVKRNFIAISKQKQIIENKKELAIEEIKLEEAQTEFKERKNQNKLIEDLQTSIQAKEEQLLIERERFNDLNKKIKEESSYLNKRFQEDRKEFDLKMESLIEENESLRKNMYELERNYKINRILGDEESIIRNKDGIYTINKNGERIRIDDITDIEKMRLRERGIIK
jgi:hypothetical protein